MESVVKGTTVVFPGPEGVKPSELYRVKVNGEECFVYHSVSQICETEGASFAIFDFAGSVTVEITCCTGFVQSACVRPKERRIVPAVQENVVTMILDHPEKLMVEINEDDRHPLFLFTSAPEAKPPAPGDTGVVYFGPGIHEIGRNYPLQPDTTYYLAGGAFLKGTMKGDITNSRIMGRGIICGRDFEWSGHYSEWGNARSDLFTFTGQNYLFEGITLLESAFYHFHGSGPGAVYRNVRLLSWYPNTDGIRSGGNTVVEDCFLRVADDAIVLCQGNQNTSVSRCVILVDRASAFQLGWNATRESGHSTVSDCDILQYRGNENESNAVIWSPHGGDALITNVRFENLRVEGPFQRLLGLHLCKHPYTKSIDFGNISGIYLKNVLIEGPMGDRIELIGQNDGHIIRDITFENLNIEGEWIGHWQYERFMKNAFTRDIRFVLTEERPELPWTPPVNLALGKETAADVSMKGFGPESAVDGYYHTLWSPGDSKPGHWLQVDLGDRHRLTGIQVVWELNAAYKYIIEASDDGTTWSRIVDRSVPRLTKQGVVDFFPDMNKVFSDRVRDTGTYRYVKLTLLDMGETLGNLRALKVLGVKK